MGEFTFGPRKWPHRRSLRGHARWQNAHQATRGALRRAIGELQLSLQHIFVLNHYFIVQPRPTKGKMRIHCLENVDKALQFLREQRVHLENMGSHDIVDGNPRLSLGLIWTIILRFQVRKQNFLLPY